MATPPRSVLITGCSDGGLGAALAVAFHEAGLHVYATARDPSKMKSLESLGVELLTLDVLSESSINSVVGELKSLDILVNNAGAAYSMPVSDLSIIEAKKLFDLNVWSYIAVTQAFLPLLLRSSNGVIVNQTSVASVTSIPFQSVYNASKAAMAMFSDAQRLELGVFGIKVVDLKTGLVQSNIIQNHVKAKPAQLPEDSIYQPAKEVVEKTLSAEQFVGQGMLADQWAEQVVQGLLKKNPPPVIWRGQQALLGRIASILPFGMLDGMMKKMTGLDLVQGLVRKQ